MAYVSKKDDFEASGAVVAKTHKIRITLTSKNVKNLEKGKARSLWCTGESLAGWWNSGRARGRRGAGRRGSEKFAEWAAGGGWDARGSTQRRRWRGKVLPA